jgi:hypothetical protein
MVMRLRRGEGEQGAPHPEAPDYAEPIVAWRLWSVVAENGLMLRSLFHSAVWPRRRPLLATCERWRPLGRMLGREHETPTEHCTCGIYGSDLRLVGDYLEEPPGIGVDAVPRVVGLVSLWGSVVECEHGWRASHAYPAAIFVPSFRWGTDGELSPQEVWAGLRGYAVPVEVVQAVRPAELIEELERDPLPVSQMSSLGGAQ